MLLLLGCERRNTENLLKDVESYIMERPDSALVVLDTMDRSLLVTDRLKAHHALLHAMALDKNYIDVTDDSIANVAVEYYSRKGPEKYEARALYYLGISYYYAQEYDKAILEFTKAEKVAERCDSLYWGMTNVIQAKTYAKTYNPIEELKRLEKARKIYKGINNNYYLEVTELYLSQALSNNERNDEARIILKEMISDDNLDPRIKESAIITYAFINAIGEDPDFDLVNRLYSELISEYGISSMEYKDFWVWAYSLYKTGNSEEAQDLIFQLTNIDTSGTADYWMYMIEKSLDNTEAALKYLENSTNKIDKEITKALRQSLSLSQRDYYESQYEIAEYKAHNRKLTIISVIIASFLVLGLIIWGTSSYSRRLQDEKNHYLNYADEIRRQLEASKSENYPELKRKYIDLYKSRFEIIGSLYEQYTLFDGKKNAEHAIYERVSAMVEDFKNDYNNRDQFESILNENLDDIVARLRREMSGLKEMDYSIFCFMLIGFDATTISHLLNTTVNVIYIRKSRMKKMIETVDPEHKMQFLEVLK